MKFKIFIVLILFTVLSVSISKADLTSISPEKELKIAQQFLENIKVFVKLYPDEFDTIKIFEFILVTRPITDGTLDDKLKEELKLFVEFTNKSDQFAKYQDEIEKNIEKGLSHKKAIEAVKKEEKKELVKKEEKKEVVKKEEKINRSNIKDKNDLTKYLIQNGLRYENYDGSYAEFKFFVGNGGTHENRIMKVGILWETLDESCFKWQNVDYVESHGYADQCIDFKNNRTELISSKGSGRKMYNFKLLK